MWKLTTVRSDMGQLRAMRFEFWYSCLNGPTKAALGWPRILISTTAAEADFRLRFATDRSDAKRTCWPFWHCWFVFKARKMQQTSTHTQLTALKSATYLLNGEFFAGGSGYFRNLFCVGVQPKLNDSLQSKGLTKVVEWSLNLKQARGKVWLYVKKHGNSYGDSFVRSGIKVELQRIKQHFLWIWSQR